MAEAVGLTPADGAAGATPGPEAGASNGESAASNRDGSAAGDASPAGSGAVEKRLAAFETTLAAMQKTMLAIHDDVRGVAERAITIEQCLAARRKLRERVNIVRAATSPALKDKPPGPYSEGKLPHWNGDHGELEA